MKAIQIEGVSKSYTEGVLAHDPAVLLLDENSSAYRRGPQG
jgi:hypothetical protein